MCDICYIGNKVQSNTESVDEEGSKKYEVKY